MAYERIHTSLSKGIETITLDYGPTLNALDMVMAGEQRLWRKRKEIRR